MVDIHFYVGPGVVSAIYFIIFDLFLLAIIDVVLIHVVSYLYYRRIHKGIPLEVRSAEIPGVATSLVGRFSSPPNLFAYFIKIGLLACILIVDSNINTEFGRSKSSASLSSTFVYNPSEEAWSLKSSKRIVERRWEAIRRCHIINEQKSNITFFNIAFNLNDGIVLESEVASLNSKYIGINDTTIQCLAHEKVSTDSSRILVQVIGCSQLEKTDCLNETSITRNGSSLKLNANNQISIHHEEGSSNATFSLQQYRKESNAIFPAYNDPNITCMRTGFGTTIESRQIFEICLVTSFLTNGSTLVERWSLDRETGTLTRKFPGPIFKGTIEIGLYQHGISLQNVISDLNWVSFSGQLIADGCIYKAEPFNIVKLGETVRTTTVPIFTVVLTIFLVVAALIARIIVASTISKNDERPRLNTVNGLSSIGREENEPTGRSMETGRGMVIGLTRRDGRSVHFGPLRSRDTGVVRERGGFVE